jgi:DNA topoisomerase-1
MTAIERLQARGIARRGSRRNGFRYRLASGSPPGRRDLQRIEQLRLPPAWRDVAIAASPRAPLQAVGRDAAGRWQYVYHAAAVRARDRRKHQRLLRFGAALPYLRRAVRADLRRRGLPREKVLAVVVRILASAYLRPGSESYAAQNGSYGLATLRRKHVRVSGDTIYFDFPGKSGQRQQRELRDRQIASVVRRLIAIPGYEVFKYLDDAGRPVDVRSADINAYIKANMGAPFSAKDFRTWAGTLVCACVLARQQAVEPANGKRSVQRAVAAAMRETAAQLGNTPAVCRSSYVNAAVPAAFAAGRVIAHPVRGVDELSRTTRGGRHRCETALLALLSRRR